jgi:hypothetical protein
LAFFDLLSLDSYLRSLAPSNISTGAGQKALGVWITLFDRINAKLRHGTQNRMVARR